MYCVIQPIDCNTIKLIHSFIMGLAHQTQVCIDPTEVCSAIKTATSSSSWEGQILPSAIALSLLCTLRARMICMRNTRICCTDCITQLTLVYTYRCTFGLIFRFAHCKCKSLIKRSPRLSVCQSRVTSRKLSEIGAKFRHLEFNGQTTKYNAKAIGTYRHH